MAANMPVRKASRIEANAVTAAVASTIDARTENYDESASDDSEFCSSINPLFILSGPRGGVIDPRSSNDQLNALIDVVDDSAFQVLSDAWVAVGVPADRYWRSPQGLHGGSAEALLLKKLASSSPTSLGLRVPNPLRLRSSFYPTRVEALSSRGYGAHRGLVPLALDRRGGSGSKMFNVLPRWGAQIRDTKEPVVESSSRIDHRSAVAEFIHAIPHPLERNLYVLVDEACPVDPYFDLDFSFDSAHDGPRDALLLQSVGEGKEMGLVTTFSTAAVEKVLLTLLRSLRQEVESEFRTTVTECLVLTSSLQTARCSTTPSVPMTLEQLKLSFHVHFRLADRTALESVRELHRFMTRLRSRLRSEEDAAAAPSSSGGTMGESSDEARQIPALLLRCVDFGVYTRWRAFRLPYNVKAPDGTDSSALASGAGDDLMVEQLRQLGITIPDNEIGAAAPHVLHNLFLAADAEACKAQRYLVKHLEQHFRFLLPVFPGVTELKSAALVEFLSQLVPPQVRAAAAEVSGYPSCPEARDVVSAWVMDLACIVRDASAFLSSRGDGEVQGVSSGSPLRLLRDGVASPPTTAEGLEQTASSPFYVRLPPMPRSVRVRIEDAGMRRLLAEVFWCLAPEYGGPDAVVPASLETEGWQTRSATKPITPERINAHYEDAIRAYYVFQKQNKYCIRLNRNHKATFAQLYLTFGSIKIRCYANDCCERCCVIPWEPSQNSQSGPQYHAGYPRYERLAEIRTALFPPLSTEELVRRYGTSVLQCV